MPPKRLDYVYLIHNKNNVNSCRLRENENKVVTLVLTYIQKSRITPKLRYSDEFPNMQCHNGSQVLVKVEYKLCLFSLCFVWSFPLFFLPLLLFQNFTHQQIISISSACATNRLFVICWRCCCCCCCCCSFIPFMTFVLQSCKSSFSVLV